MSAQRRVRIADGRVMNANGPARSRRLISIAVAVVAGALSGCRTGAPPLHFPPGAMVLNLASISDVPTLDPAAGYDVESWMFEQMIFDTLVRYSDAGVDLVPDLATAWQSSPDATTFTFHLRRDAHFTDGRSVTSTDFKYAIERVLDPATRSKGIEYYRAIAGAADFIAHRTKAVAGIETPDPWTIVFHLAAPDPIFLHKLAMPFASAVPRELVEKWGEDFSRHVVGSGPFILKEWVGGQRIVLAKNPQYFVKCVPHLDAVVESIGVSEDLQWFKFEGGEIDVSSIPPAVFPSVLKTPRLRKLTLRIVTVTTRYLGMNCQMPPFNDERVRRAFNYAVNKPKLIAVLHGRGIVANGVMPPGLPGFDPHLSGYPYNPARARQLLEQAGLAHGFEATLWMPADQTMMILGQSVQQDLDLVGVHLMLKAIAFPPFLVAIRQPQTVPLFFSGWEADFPDPANFLDVLLSRQQWGANNDAFFSDPRVDALLAEAAPLSDLARRYGIYDEAERIIVDDAPWVFLYYPITYEIQQPWVHGYVLNPMRPARLENVWLSPHPAR
jgi:oligopeptide transport system substrate-binding protein